MPKTLLLVTFLGCLIHVNCFSVERVSDSLRLRVEAISLKHKNIEFLRNNQKNAIVTRNKNVVLLWNSSIKQRYAIHSDTKSTVLLRDNLWCVIDREGYLRGVLLEDDIKNNKNVKDLPVINSVVWSINDDDGCCLINKQCVYQDPRRFYLRSKEFSLGNMHNNITFDVYDLEKKLLIIPTTECKNFVSYRDDIGNKQTLMHLPSKLIIQNEKIIVGTTSNYKIITVDDNVLIFVNEPAPAHKMIGFVFWDNASIHQKNLMIICKELNQLIHPLNKLHMDCIPGTKDYIIYSFVDKKIKIIVTDILNTFIILDIFFNYNEYNSLINFSNENISGYLVQHSFPLSSCEYNGKSFIVLKDKNNKTGVMYMMNIDEIKRIQKNYSLLNEPTPLVVSAKLLEFGYDQLITVKFNDCIKIDLYNNIFKFVDKMQKTQHFCDVIVYNKN